MGFGSVASGEGTDRKLASGTKNCRCATDRYASLCKRQIRRRILFAHRLLPVVFLQVRGTISETESIRVFSKGVGMPMSIGGNEGDVSIRISVGRSYGLDHDSTPHRRPHEGAPRPMPLLGERHQLRDAAAEPVRRTCPVSPAGGRPADHHCGARLPAPPASAKICIGGRYKKRR